MTQWERAVEAAANAIFEVVTSPDNTSEEIATKALRAALPVLFAYPDDVPEHYSLDAHRRALEEES